MHIAVMHIAVSIGNWSYPHPEPLLAAQGKHVTMELFERPPDSAKPKSVTVHYMDEENKPQQREVPFQEPVLGASSRCDGCGEPFGQQVRVADNLWVSPFSAAFQTDRGLLRFCQDTYSCSRRAADRVPRFADRLVEQQLQQIHEETGGGIPVGSKVCKNPNCKQIFVPLHARQEYHITTCKQRANVAKTYARYKKKTGKSYPRNTKPKQEEAVVG